MPTQVLIARHLVGSGLMKNLLGFASINSRS